MPDEIRIRYASQRDDAGIVSLMSRLAIPGSISLGYNYASSYLSALSVEGSCPKIVVADKGGEICGVGSILSREVYLQGKPATVGYLSSLRVAPEIHGSLTLARGFRLFKVADELDFDVPFYLTSILDDNHTAKSILTSGRAGLPPYNFLSGYQTLVFPVLRKKKSLSGLKVINGARAGVSAIYHCLQEYGKEKDFFSRYNRKDLTESSGIMKGLTPSDFLVAFDQGEPVGTVGLWDQSSFKNLVVRKYPLYLQLLKRFFELICKQRILPKINIPFAPTYLSCIAICNNDPIVFKQLLVEAMNQTLYRKNNLLILGLFVDDKLLQSAKSFYHLSFLSNIYLVSWNRNIQLDAYELAPKYLDIGSL